MKFVYDNFDLLFDKAGSVDAFKKLILDMAVRGKLVPQDPNDEPARLLIEKVKKEREKLIEKGVIKKENPLPQIREDALRNDLPEGWEWVRLDSIVMPNKSSIRRGPFGSSIRKDMFVPKSADSYKVYEQKNAIQKDYSLGSYFITKDKFKELRNFIAKAGDIIISCAGTIGEAYLLPYKAPEGVINQALLKITLNNEVILDDYFLHLFANLTKASLNQNAKGSAMKNIMSIDVLKRTVFPLPPYQEQYRIVKKIEEIFEMIPHLEEAFEKRTKYNRQLSHTSLNRLTDAKSRDDLVSSMQFVTNNFDSLYDNIENVKDLRQAILTLAVQGKLVLQDPYDEPAIVLLDKIHKEKERLIEDGKLKKEKPLPSIKEKDLPYPSPHNWMWIRIGEIIQNKLTGIVRSSGQQNKAYKYPYFKMNNINNDGSCNFNNIINVSATEIEVSKFRLEENEFLFNTRNSRELVGKTCVIENIPYDVLLFNNNILKIEFYKQFINNKYINLWFNSTPGKMLLNQYKSNTTNVCAIYQKQLVTYLIPIPPLNEQKRIVNKVDEALLLCDDLESHLISFEKVYKHLLSVVLYEAI